MWKSPAGANTSPLMSCPTTTWRRWWTPPTSGIRTRSGISERRLVAKNEATSDIAAAAGRMAMERAGIGPEDLDLIILATVTPDYPSIPATASLVQDILGAKCGAFDLAAGCSGFVYGLVTGSQFVLSGACRNVLLIGAEVFSRVLDWRDRKTCVLFGDGAGAVVLRATDGREDCYPSPLDLMGPARIT